MNFGEEEYEGLDYEGCIHGKNIYKRYRLDVDKDDEFLLISEIFRDMCKKKQTVHNPKPLITVSTFLFYGFDLI